MGLVPWATMGCSQALGGKPCHRALQWAWGPSSSSPHPRVTLTHTALKMKSMWQYSYMPEVGSPYWYEHKHIQAFWPFNIKSVHGRVFRLFCSLAGNQIKTCQPCPIIFAAYRPFVSSTDVWQPVDRMFQTSVQETTLLLAGQIRMLHIALLYLVRLFLFFFPFLLNIVWIPGVKLKGERSKWNWNLGDRVISNS